MAPDASKALGAEQIAGTFVSPRDHTWNVTTSVVGAAGREPDADTPYFSDIGYVAVTADQVAIVKGKHGLFKPKVGTEVIARGSRAHLVSAELDGGLLKAAMHFDFADGTSWEFEVPKIYRGTAEQVVRTLTAAPPRPGEPRA